MSMAQGFVQGFGMMNQFMQQQDAKERQAALDAQNEQRYQDQLKWRDQQWQHQLGREKMQDDLANETKVLSRAQMGIDPTNMTLEQQAGVLMNKNAIAAQQAEEDRQLKRQEHEANMQVKKAQLNNYWLDSRASQFKWDKEQEQAAWQQFIAYGDDSKLNSSQREYLRGIDKRGAEFDFVANNFTNLEQAIQVEKDPVKRGDMALQFAGIFSTPEGRNVLNSAVMPDLAKRQRENPNIKKITASGIEVIDGKVALLMDIEYKDGKVVEGVPATKNRTGDPNDELSLQPISALKKNIMDVYAIRSRQQELKDKREALNKQMQENPDLARGIYGFKPGEEIKNLGDGGNSVNVLTGEPVVGAGANDKNALKQERLDFDKLRSVQKALADQYAATLDPNEKAKLGAQWSAITAMIVQSVTSADKVTTSAGQGLPIQPTTSGANTAPSSKFDFAGRLPSPASIPDKK